MMKIFKVVLAAFGIMLNACVAHAATVSSVQGTASVNSGEGFQHVKAGHRLSTGDRVMVSAAGQAALTFDDGCVFELKPAHVLSVGKSSPCKSAMRSVRTLDFNGRMGATENNEEVISDQTQTILYVLGGAALIGGAIVLIADDDDRPASP